MDMDELFSQVDEKRKVSIEIFFHSFVRSLSAFSRSCCWRWEVYRTRVPFVLADTLARGAHTLTAHQRCMIVDMATRA